MEVIENVTSVSRDTEVPVIVIVSDPSIAIAEISSPGKIILSPVPGAATGVLLLMICPLQ